MSALTAQQLCPHTAEHEDTYLEQQTSTQSRDSDPTYLRQGLHSGSSTTARCHHTPSAPPPHRLTSEDLSSLVHGNTGRMPANATSAALIERLHLSAGRGGIYHDFNVSHLSEVLIRDQEIHLAHSTLSRLLSQHRIRPRLTPGLELKRARRERRSQEGAMLQIDGSPHDWLEGRAPRMALLGAVDDATGKLMEDRKVTPVIDRRYRLSEVPEAIRYLEEGHAQGKVIITLEHNN